MNPAPANKMATIVITPDKTLGNFLGSFMDSVIGITLFFASAQRIDWRSRNHVQSNTFKGEDSCSNKKREAISVKQHDLRYPNSVQNNNLL